MAGGGRSLAPGRDERDAWDDLPLPGRLLDALRSLNPGIPNEQLVQARAEILAPQSNDDITENQRAHEWMTRGYRITYTDQLGTEHSPTLRVISAEPSENDWLAVNQVTIKRAEGTRRFDVGLYCNGLPVAVVELKKAGSAHADLDAAHAQLATYLREFPIAFRYCVLIVISDGITARYGTPFTELNHYSPWNVDVDGRVLPDDAPAPRPAHLRQRAARRPHRRPHRGGRRRHQDRSRPPARAGMNVLSEVDRHLSTAGAFLDGSRRLSRVTAPRAACWFTRRGLESLLPALLARRGLELGTSNTRSRLICLAVAYADQGERARDLVSAWDQLSTACHHHAYELTPTFGEASDLLRRVRAGRDLC